MHSPDVEGIVPSPAILESHGEVAHNAGNDTDDDRTGRSHIPRSRGDGGQPRHRPGEQS